MTKEPFICQLVPNTIPHKTIRELEQLLADARHGRLLGVATIALYQHREFTTSVTDELYRNPTFARGTVAALDDHLRTLQGVD